MTYERAAEILDPEHRETYRALRSWTRLAGWAGGSVPAGCQDRRTRTGTRTSWPALPAER